MSFGRDQTEAEKVKGKPEADEWGEWQKRYRELNMKVIMATIEAAIVILLLFWLCGKIGVESDTVLNYSHLLLGLAVGWLLGTITSPYTTKEEGQFSNYAKVVSALVSGYFLAKLDKVVDRMFDPEYLMQTIVIFRGMTFLTATIVAMVLTFVHRKYGSEDDKSAEATQEE